MRNTHNRAKIPLKTTLLEKNMDQFGILHALLHFEPVCRASAFRLNWTLLGMANLMQDSLILSIKW